MKIRFLFVGICCFFFAFTLYAQSIDSEEITLSELKNHMSVLASDLLQGRKPGTPGGSEAALYVAEGFSQSGLEMVFENGFQPFDVVTTVHAGENNHCEFKSFHGIINKDFNPLSFSKNGSFQGAVVFAGYGFDLETDSLSWHDYKGMDIHEKWVMILQGHPDNRRTNDIFSEHSSLRKKALVARDHGAGGILFVSGKMFDEKDELIALYYDKSQGDVGIPVLHIKRSIADQLLALSGKHIDELEEALNQSMAPVPCPVEETVTAEVNLMKQKAGTQNVVGLIRGYDQKLSDEYIVLGAHYDHLGLGGPGSGSRKPDTTAVHNGADDNASGVAAMLEISEKLAAHRHELKRSVLFVAFGAEEMGTVGSKYFTDNPPVRIDQMKAMINLDMVGRLDNESKTLSLGGTGTAQNFESRLANHLQKVDLKGSYSREGYGPSDHASFYSHGIPVLSVMTGIHQDYHTPDDDIDKINFEGQKKVSEFIYSLIVDLASGQDGLVYQEAGPKTRPGTRRRFKVTLGIMPDVAAGDVEGLRVSAVMPDRPALKAGLEKGDVIIAIEGRKVADIYEYMHRLSELNEGQRISVEVMRQGEKKIFIVEL